MLWRTYATTVVPLLVSVMTITAHETVSDRATLTLQGTVPYHASVSIRPSNEGRVVEAATNIPGGVSLSVERASGTHYSSLTINGVPARFENGFAHVADVRPGGRDGVNGSVVIAYASSSDCIVGGEVIG